MPSSSKAFFNLFRNSPITSHWRMGLVWNKEALNAVLESWGISAAWQFTQEKQLLAAYQLQGKMQEFLKLRDAVGLEEALRRRDEPFERAGF